MKWAVALIALGLSGCAGSVGYETLASPEQKAKDDTEYCQKYGYHHTDPAFASCLQLRAQWRQQQYANNVQLMAVGAQMSANSHAPARRPIMCTSNTSIGTTTTMCN